MDEALKEENEELPRERCSQCGTLIQVGREDCSLCQAPAVPGFKIDMELVEDRVEVHLFALSAEYDIKSLRLADDNEQLTARGRIREMVRDDESALNLFERGVVLQHLLNIVFNSSCD